MKRFQTTVILDEPEYSVEAKATVFPCASRFDSDDFYDIISLVITPKPGYSEDDLPNKADIMGEIDHQLYLQYKEAA